MFKRVLLGAGTIAVWLLVGATAVFVFTGRSPLLGGKARSESLRFEEALRHIQAESVREVDLDQLAEKALDAALHSLDPHSDYMTEREYADFRDDTRGEFGGIGVHIEMRDDRLTVVAPIPGTPGERAGLMRGDQFIEVDGLDMHGLPLPRCLEALRGPPGTEVQVKLLRPRTSEKLSHTLTREIIRVSSVRDARLLDGGIGVIRIVQFAEKTSPEFLDALAGLERKGLRALVIDLRDNPGGLLDAAVEIAQIFLPAEHLVVYTQGRAPESRAEYRAQPEGQPRRYPVAVLINSGSASASEIVAGVLRDTARARLIGEKSFGKGSVQSIIPLRAGAALRLTTAFYYTPSGTLIHGQGLQPDVPIELTAEEDRQLAIQRNRLSMLSNDEFTEQFGFSPIPDRALAAAEQELLAALASDTTTATPAVHPHP